MFFKLLAKKIAIYYFFLICLCILLIPVNRPFADSPKSKPCVVGNGIVKSMFRTLPKFSQIKIDGVFTVKIKCQGKNEVQIIAEENIIPHIVSTVNKNILTLSADQSMSTNRDILINLTTDQIEKITASGASRIIVSGIHNDAFVLSLQGTDEAFLSGETVDFSAQLEGSGDLTAKELKSVNATIDISGSGNARVFTSEKLSVTITGVGGVIYSGHPKKIKQDIQGVGNVVSE